MNTRTRSALAALAALVALGLAGCAASAPSADIAPSSAAAEVVTVHDAWVKTAVSGMTAGFGVLTNTGDADVTVTAVTTDAAAMSELHETVEDKTGTMIMRRIEGGFVLPAGADFPLEPAGNHLMMMELTGPLAAGDEVPFTLEFSDGSTLDFVAVVKDYAGANENYVGDEMDMESDEQG